MIRGWKNFKFLFILIILDLMAGCATVRTYRAPSKWLDRQIFVDGKADDWKGTQFFLEKEQIVLGLLNDQDFLYFNFVVHSRPRVSQIISQGLILWFDEKGKKKKNWGIKYPLGVIPERRQFPRMFGPPEDREKEKPMMLPSELEIIKSGKEEPERIEVMQAKKKGLEIQASFEPGVFVYELKIPLRLSEKNLLAVGAEPGKIISLGLEIGELRLGRQPLLRAGGGMGRPPSGEGFGPQARVGGFGPRQEMPQPLKIWLIYQLSSGETPKEAKLLAT